MSESTLQQACVRWLTLQHKHKGLIAASFPNEGKRSFAEAQRLKNMGMTMGMPDLAIFWNSKTLFIEFKFGANKSTPNQSLKQELLRGQGFEVHEIREFDSFVEVVNNFLK